MTLPAGYYRIDPEIAGGCRQRFPFPASFHLLGVRVTLSPSSSSFSLLPTRDNPSRPGPRPGAEAKTTTPTSGMGVVGDGAFKLGSFSCFQP